LVDATARDFGLADVPKVRVARFVKVDGCRAEITVHDMQAVEMGHPARDSVGDDHFLGIREFRAVLDALGQGLDDSVRDNDKLGFMIFVEDVPANNRKDDGVLSVELDKGLAEKGLDGSANSIGVRWVAVDWGGWIDTFQGHGNIHELVAVGGSVPRKHRDGAVMDGIEKQSGPVFFHWIGVDLKVVLADR
jgi:hypothetical protein